MKSKLFAGIFDENSNHTSFHSKCVCVMTSETHARVAVSKNGSVDLFEYSRQEEELVHRSRTELISSDKPSILLSSSVTPSGTAYNLDSTGCIHAVPVTTSGFGFRESLDGLQNHFQRAPLGWADIIAGDDKVLVSHGTHRTIHVLSPDGRIMDHIKLGTYSSAMADLTSNENVVATAEGSEVVLYDIRSENHSEGKGAQRFFMGKEKLLAVTEGALPHQVIASGYSRSLAFLDIRTGRLGSQMNAHTKYEVNFVHNERSPKYPKNSADVQNISFVAGIDAELKVVDMNTKSVIGSAYADDCWSGRPTAQSGVFAGVSVRGSLLVADILY